MLNNPHSKSANIYFICKSSYTRPCYLLFTVLLYCICCMQSVLAQQVTNINIDEISGAVSWLVDDMPWYANVKKDKYFGSDIIPIISVDITTGNEAFVPAARNCYYRGTLTDSVGTPITKTYAFMNMCQDDPHYFTGFVSDQYNVYTIEEDPDSPGHLIMQIDDPTIPLTTPNESNAGNNGGKGKVLTPDKLEPRNSTVENFPSVEILVEPTFVSTFGDPGYIHRIASTVAFANFIYEQSGMKQMTLISINLLSDVLNQNGGIGGIRHQLQNLRRSTVQADSGDVSILMVGGDIDSTYTWGWAIDASACELQIAVDLDEDINTIEVGRSAAFVTDLPSLIQRGWILAHEFGHVIGALKHIDSDPLMDGWFQEIPTLANYIAGCDAKSQIFASCAYDPKSKKEIDFYNCD